MVFGYGLKGWFGEAKMALAKRLALDPNEYRDINNVTISTSNGTTQIDHIIVSRFGIFVIETKNREGWILGDANARQWTQSLYGDNFQFQNPLFQNHRHIKSLQELLKLPPSCFHSVVCFVGSTSRLMTALPDNVMCGGPWGYIKSKTTVLLSDRQADAAVWTIETSMRPHGFAGTSTWETRREHEASLEERHNSTTKCPRCGGHLVLRTAKKGYRAGQQFYGCNKYPVCRFIRNAD